MQTNAYLMHQKAHDTSGKHRIANPYVPVGPLCFEPTEGRKIGSCLRIELRRRRVSSPVKHDGEMTAREVLASPLMW